MNKVIKVVPIFFYGGVYVICACCYISINCGIRGRKEAFPLENLDPPVCPANVSQNSLTKGSN